uniref:Uncharacterized protein n=1 Tax=Anguilla anguilla TaxID=7936 RepID=A0A0E9Q654_ANGAN
MSFSSTSFHFPSYYHLSVTGIHLKISSLGNELAVSF